MYKTSSMGADSSPTFPKPQNKTMNLLAQGIRKMLEAKLAQMNANKSSLP